MARVRRGNKELTIGDNEVNKYLASGYDLLDATGKVVRSGISNDITALRAENEQLKLTVEKQAKQIAELKRKKVQK